MVVLFYYASPSALTFVHPSVIFSYSAISLCCITKSNSCVLCTFGKLSGSDSDPNPDPDPDLILILI